MQGDGVLSILGTSSLFLKDGVAYVQAGGGIVADSEPESEYQETIHKASALFRAIDKAEGL